MSAVYQLKNTNLNPQHLQRVKKNILKYSPYPEKVQIIVVTKAFSFKAIKSAEEQTLFHVGESKIQETQQKIKNNQLNAQTKIHLIGHLQTNKVKKAVQIYNVIQSVDSIKLLLKINTEAERNNKKQKIFLQTKLADSKTKTGLSKQETLLLAEKTQKLKNIHLCGVMSIGPNTKKKNETQRHFIEIKEIQKKIQQTIEPTCKFLSLGMSQDYQIALQIGATHIRLGTVLFENRYE